MDTTEVKEWEEAGLSERQADLDPNGTIFSVGPMTNDATGEMAIDIRVRTAATTYAALITQDHAKALIRAIEASLRDCERMNSDG